MRNLRLILTLGVLIGTVACSNRLSTPATVLTVTSTLVDTSVQPATVTPALTATSTLAVIASATSEPTATSTPTIPTPLSSYASLPPGQYIVYQDEADEGAASSNLYAISLDGKHKQTLTNRLLHFDYLTMLSDGKRLLVYQGNMQGITIPSSDFVLNLESNTISDIEQPQGDCFKEYSPDLSVVALSFCTGSDGSFDRNIYIEWLDDHTRFPITALSRPSDVYYYPVWSPNGKWVAYFNLPGTDTGLGKHDIEDGLYLMDTSCLANPLTCPSKTKGPYYGGKWMYMQGPLTWSPDNRFLAMVSDPAVTPMQIQIFDTETSNFRFLDIEEIDIGPGSLLWSPDGQWLAYTLTYSYGGAETGLYIVPVASGDPIYLVDSGGVYLHFWLSIPAFQFQVGGAYTITEAGVDLNLRDNPSLNASVLTKLQPGDFVVFLDGPVYADGYSWWQIRLDPEGIVGWAVEQSEWYTMAPGYPTPTP